MKKIKIILKGHLRDKLGEYVEVYASTAREAIRSLSSNYASQLKAPLEIGRWPVQVKGFDRIELFDIPIQVDELEISPADTFSKGGGFLNIVIGTVLVIVGVIVGLVFGWTGVGGAIAGGLIAAGIGMMAGGLMQILYPSPEIKNTAAQGDPEASKYLGAPRNTVAIGTRIPICYGRYKIYGHFLSFDITAKDVKI